MNHRTYKIALLGEPGAGKTTGIGAVSDVPPVVTDVACTDDLARVKEYTTVAMDYGEMTLSDDERLLLYGLPGQPRFRFMFDVVKEGLVGVVILVDAATATPMEGFDVTMDTYQDQLTRLPLVVVVNKARGNEVELLERIQASLRRRQLIAPTIVADVRGREQMASIFELIFLCAEYGDA